MSKGLQTAWFKGVDEDSKEGVRREIVGAIGVLERLHGILDTKHKEALKALTKPDYTTDWSHTYADKAGYARALSEILTLITIEGMDV